MYMSYSEGSSHLTLKDSMVFFKDTSIRVQLSRVYSSCCSPVRFCLGFDSHRDGTSSGAMDGARLHVAFSDWPHHMRFHRSVFCARVRSRVVSSCKPGGGGAPRRDPCTVSTVPRSGRSERTPSCCEYHSGYRIWRYCVVRVVRLSVYQQTCHRCL